MPEYDIDALIESDDEDSQLITKLRGALKAQAKAHKETNDKLAEFSKKDRTRTIQDKFTEYGVPKKLARFALAEIEDPTDENVANWLRDNQDDFGFELKVSDEDNQERETQERLGQLGGRSRVVTAESREQEISARIKAAKSPEEIMQILNGG